MKPNTNDEHLTREEVLSKFRDAYNYGRNLPIPKQTNTSNNNEHNYCNWLILLTFLLVLTMFIILIINPHQERRDYFERIVVSNGFLQSPLMPLPSDKCICNNNAYIDIVDWVHTKGGKAVCECLVNDYKWVFFR